MTSTSHSDVSHPVVFTTQSAYPLPSQKFMIPGSWRRYQLSQLVNKSLSLAKPIPFDFLVRGDILRTTLAEWCADKGVGEEETLEIEYFESIMPPQKMTILPHEDWVASVSCHERGHFLTTSYDGSLRIFDYSQTLLQTIPVHEAPATCLAILPEPTGQDSASKLVLTTSHDLTARLTRIEISSSTSTSSSRTLASFHLHTSPLTSICSNASGSHLLTTSVDGLIGLWDSTVPEEDEVPLEESHSDRDSKKRRRVTEDKNRPKRKSPIAVLKSHTARVSKAAFLPEEKAKAVSAGFDSTVRIWDTENGVCVNTIAMSSKPFLDLVPVGTDRTALAASTDRTVCQYDLRAGEKSATAQIATFMHPATPSCLATSSSPAGSDHQFITGAYDGSVRLWDMRSYKSPVTTFKAWDGRSGGKKILSVDWAHGLVGIGGEAGVEVWKVDRGEHMPSNSS